MIFITQPGGCLTGELQIPGDKSISHRAIMFAALAEGPSYITGFLASEDCMATVEAFRSMGVAIEGLQQENIVVRGVGMRGLLKPQHALDLGNSGTAMRLLAGILVGQSFSTELTGDASLKQRPMNRIVEPLTRMGAKIQAFHGTPPLKIMGKQSLTGICYTLPIASSQLKSCLLLAGMYAHGETCIIQPDVSRDHTERMMQVFNYPCHVKDNMITLTGGHQLKGTSLTIPADLSSAAFFIVAASIAPGSDILLKDVGINATRIGVINILKKMGADINFNNLRHFNKEPVADIQVRYAPLRGITITPDLVSLAIDECPILLIAAACAEGETVLQGAAELRVKETDRIKAMVIGLQQLGIDVTELEDGVYLKGGIMRGGNVDSFDDHRIAMAFSMAAIRAKESITIHNCKNVATSFPGFVELAQKAGLKISNEE